MEELSEKTTTELQSLLADLPSSPIDYDPILKPSDTKNYRDEFRIPKWRRLKLAACVFIFLLIITSIKPILIGSDSSQEDVTASSLSSTRPASIILQNNIPPSVHPTLRTITEKSSQPLASESIEKNVFPSINPTISIISEKSSQVLAVERTGRNGKIVDTSVISDGFEVMVETNPGSTMVIAKEFIAKGTLVWKFGQTGREFNSTRHHKLRKFVNNLKGEELNYFLDHAYGFDKGIRISNSIADYIQHDSEANLVARGGDDLFASRDIQKGDVLSKNYFNYDVTPQWFFDMVADERPNCVHLINKWLSNIKQDSGTWSRHCYSNILRNETFGQTYAPFVDKILAKHYVASLNTSVKIPKTYMTFNKQNFSKATIKQALKDFPVFVLKPNHYSGGIAKLDHANITCLKLCVFTHPTVAHKTHWQKLEKHINWYLNRKYNNRGQLQYKYIEPHMLLEEFLDMGLVNGYAEYGFYCVGGAILDVQVMCSRSQFAFVNTNFHQLPVTGVKDEWKPCASTPKKPANWDEMVSIARTVSSNIPELVRVDLYSNGEDAYFSELTFTPDTCNQRADPKTLDKLYLWTLKHQHLKNAITPGLLRCVIEETRKIAGN